MKKGVHNDRLIAMPRSARSAALLSRQIRPSSRKRVKAVPAFEHVIHRLGEVVAARQLGALFTHPALEIGDQRRTRVLAQASRSSARTPLMSRSMAKSSSHDADEPRKLLHVMRGQRRAAGLGSAIQAFSAESSS